MGNSPARAIRHVSAESFVLQADAVLEEAKLLAITRMYCPEVGLVKVDAELKHVQEGLLSNHGL